MDPYDRHVRQAEIQGMKQTVSFLNCGCFAGLARRSTASHPAGPAAWTGNATPILESELSQPLDLKEAAPLLTDFEFGDSWRTVLDWLVGVSAEHQQPSVRRGQPIHGLQIPRQVHELLSNVVDEAVSQAATLGRTMPSWNLVSLATSMRCVAASRIRQWWEADSASLKSIVRVALRVPLPLVRR